MATNISNVTKIFRDPASWGAGDLRNNLKSSERNAVIKSNVIQSAVGYNNLHEDPAVLAKSFQNDLHQLSTKFQKFLDSEKKSLEGMSGQHDLVMGDFIYTILAQIGKATEYNPLLDRNEFITEKVNRINELFADLVNEIMHGKYPHQMEAYNNAVNMSIQGSRSMGMSTIQRTAQSNSTIDAFTY